MIWKYNFSYDGNTLNMSHISNKRFSQIDMIKMIEIILIMTVLHTRVPSHVFWIIFVVHLISYSANIECICLNQTLPTL